MKIKYRVKDYIDYWEWGASIVWENPVVCDDWSQLPTNETIEIISVETE